MNDAVKTASRPEPARVPALGKAIAILRFLNGAPRLSAGVSEIASALGIAKSHCFNILRTLEAEGWVGFDPERRRYALSARLLTDVSRLLTDEAQAASVHEELARLSQAARLPCVLTRVEPDGTFTAIDKAEGAAELLVSVPIGHRFPLDAPAQMRTRLAFAEARERDRAVAEWSPVAYTPTTIVDKAALVRELEATRARGYAISRAEFTPGVMTIAVPVFDPAGRVGHVLQCPGLDSAVPTRETDVAPLLVETATRIGRLLGARRG